MEQLGPAMIDVRTCNRTAQTEFLVYAPDEFWNGVDNSSQRDCPEVTSGMRSAPGVSAFPSGTFQRRNSMLVAIA
jgi:hypothetical protein